MQVQIHRELTDSLIKDIHRLSVLMEDARQPSAVVFVTITHLLEQQQGCFFTVVRNNQKLGFGFFSYCASNNSLRKLKYFAIKTKYRAKGFGCRALNAVFEADTSASGYVLTCRPELQLFYEKIGFKYAQPAPSDNDDIILTKNDTADMSQLDIVDADYYTVRIDQNPD